MKKGALCSDLLHNHSWMNPEMHETALKLVNKWLRNPPNGSPLYVSPVSPYVSSSFTYCFTPFV